MGVWIETQMHLNYAQAKNVTPFVGVWIETRYTQLYYDFVMSHPSWVCGLKLSCMILSGIITQSHPSWVCGLKLILWVCMVLKTRVTPFVGVWIETLGNAKEKPVRLVTPFVGVWIETEP